MVYKTTTALATVFALAAGMASAEVKIGFLSDMSGATSVLTGESAKVAVEMAIEDFGGSVNGEPIKLIVADHMNKPDVGLGLAREMLDVEKVDLLQSVDNSAVALAVSDLIKDKPVMMIHGASASKLTNENCLPNQIQMLMDPYGLSRAITMPLVKQGESRWFFIAVDYAFGHDLEAKGIAGVKEAGGEVVGSVRHAPNTTDFSAF
ncbi:MAG: ABC transporter substrate-binding protein, partial [Gemmobacter sp.]